MTGQVGQMALGLATSAKSGSTISAKINGQTVTVQVARDLTVASGDTVLVNKVGTQWYVIQRLYTAAPATIINPDLPNPKPASYTGTLVVPPVETRSRSNGIWRMDTDDVIQGSYGSYATHIGAAFYGTQPQSLSGTTVTSAHLFVRRLTGGSAAARAATLRLVTETTRPANDPTLTSSATGPSLAAGDETQAFAVTTSWAQSMVDGTAGGLAVYEADGDPFLRFAGRSAWSAGWTLVINWRRG